MTLKETEWVVRLAPVGVPDRALSMVFAACAQVLTAAARAVIGACT